MLLQLTNKCNMGCAHCLQDSNPNGESMSLLTLKRSVEFAKYLNDRVLLVSGGEITECEDFFDKIKNLSFYIQDIWPEIKFTILSNGWWIKNYDIKKKIIDITKLPEYMGMQIYTNPKWYRNYNFVISHRKDYESIPGAIFCGDTDIMSMQDLGRAKTNSKAQEEIDKSPYFMSCLNSALIANQLKHGIPELFTMYQNTRGKFCHPLIDINGNVHLSESWLCPSVGNIQEGKFDNIWKNMTEFKPCFKCKNSKKFLKSDRNDIKQARKVFNYE